jgi:hypothetical protein
MTAEQAATLKRLAEAAYEREAFQPKLTRAEADQTAPTDIQNYAEQNADKLEAIATFEKARGFTTHTLE